MSCGLAVKLFMVITSAECVTTDFRKWLAIQTINRKSKMLLGRRDKRSIQILVDISYRLGELDTRFDMGGIKRED